MPPPHDIAASLAEAARSLAARQSLQETLEVIVSSAHASVPGMEHVGISTIDSRGRVTTRAATDDLVLKLDQLQYDLGEGPCMDALREATKVTVPHLRHDQRWPRYVPGAAALGVRSQMGVQLFLDDEGTLGGLNLYSTSRDDLDPTTESVAELFAAHAAVALGRARTVGQLEEALASRKVIGQALGIVMERYHLDEDRAFAFLTRASSHGNLKLRDVAQQLVDEAGRRGR